MSSSSRISYHRIRISFGKILKGTEGGGVRERELSIYSRRESERGFFFFLFCLRSEVNKRIFFSTIGEDHHCRYTRDTNKKSLRRS